MQSELATWEIDCRGYTTMPEWQNTTISTKTRKSKPVPRVSKRTEAKQKKEKATARLGEFNSKISDTERGKLEAGDLSAGEKLAKANRQAVGAIYRTASRNKPRAAARNIAGSQDPLRTAPQGYAW